MENKDRKEKKKWIKTQKIAPKQRDWSNEIFGG